MNFDGFALMPYDNSKETIAVHAYCTLQDTHIPCKIFYNWKDIPDTFVPVGTVEWCLKILKKKIVPDYYPDFLNHTLYRNIWKTNEWPLGHKVFIKPADKYKRFTGFVTSGTYKKKKRGPFICSDVIAFNNEWRYYIANGKVLAAEWYWGDETNTPPAPRLEDFGIIFPENFSCAADFGILKTGQFALVEVQHPFSCGWYGVGTKTGCKYVEWLVNGWQYMKDLVSNVN